MGKVFDSELYRISDARAKMASTLFFNAVGYTAIIEPECYDYDMIIERDGKRMSVEAEHKRCWTSVTFPDAWATIDVPYRKHKVKADLFIMFNESFNACIVASMDDIKASPVRTKDTCYTQQERFYMCDKAIYSYWFINRDQWIRSSL